MRVLMVSDMPFAGLRHRPQQIAIGLAREGHDVLYLAPTCAYRQLFQPDRFQAASISDPPPSHKAATPPSGSTGADLPGAADVPDRLQLRELPESQDLRDAATLRDVWKQWGDLVRTEIEQLCGAGPRAGAGGRFEAEIIYCDHPAPLPALKSAAGIPVVIDCSGDFEAQVVSRSAIEAYREALSKALPMADGMVANHRYMIESWDRYLADEAPRTVIEHGVDLDLFKPTPDDRRVVLRRELEILDDRPMITFLGHVDARISYEDLQTMMESVPDPVFVFVGQVRPDGLSMLQRLPADRIRPLGALRPEKAAEIVGTADALILPFRREPHLEAVRGLNLYEYFATGRPIAASFRRALKAYREQMYLYTTQSELRAALRDAVAEGPISERIGQRLALAREASWSERVAQLIKFMQSVLAG